MSNTPTPSADGRRLRSERSRTAIIEAAIALVEEGTLVPTAQQISDRAGVGIRSFFRHFADMETLFEALDLASRENYISPFSGGDRGGSLAERIDHAAAKHADGYEQVQHVVLSTLAQRWRYPILRKNYARYQRNLRKDLDDWLPELEQLPKPQREAVDAVASFEMWNRLRDHQGLSKAAATEVVSDLLKRILL